MNKLFVASNNVNKLKEIKDILVSNNLEIELFSPKSFNDTSEVNEDGKTFKQNAYIKAKYFYDLYHLPTLADDSGLSIKYFNNYPGVYSARFLNQYDYKTKNEKILKMLEGIKNRSAFYTCDICFIDDTGPHFYEGIINGEIALEAKGHEGFGYDPIFYLKQYHKTTAELGDDFKKASSHRAIALKEWINDVKQKI